MGNSDSQIRDAFENFGKGVGNACNDAWNQIGNSAQGTGNRCNEFGNEMNFFFMKQEINAMNSERT